MYIRGLIPRNFAKLAEAVPIAFNPVEVEAREFGFFRASKTDVYTDE